MSMASCPKCWDVLCGCGWEYKTMNTNSRLDIAAAALGVTVDTIKAVIDVPLLHPMTQDPSWNNRTGEATHKYVEMRLCEVDHVLLRPDQLYKFTVDPNCSKCQQAAASYRTNHENPE